MVRTDFSYNCSVQLFFVRKVCCTKSNVRKVPYEKCLYEKYLYEKSVRTIIVRKVILPKKILKYFLFSQRYVFWWLFPNFSIFSKIRKKSSIFHILSSKIYLQKTFYLKNLLTITKFIDYFIHAEKPLEAKLF
jgi:hypothetical protein